MAENAKRNGNVFCTNCGKQGHTMKQCQEPITSHGIILIRYNPGNLTNQPCVLSIKDGVNQDSVEILLIRRRDTLGFIELMRGKYAVTDIEYIRKHISIMTKEEHTKLLTQTFQQLWEGLWGRPVEGSMAYKHEREMSREKLEVLQSSGVLKKLIGEVVSPYEEAEWGFPKGRRELFETDTICAVREVFEETNISDSSYTILKNVEPIIESFRGSNGIRYMHKYFLACMNETKELANPATNVTMSREIGSLAWIPLDAALEKIRDYNHEKKSILLRIQEILRNYCPLFIPSEIDERRGYRKDPYESGTPRRMGYRKR
jgi:8-oxo-dGTP pyrophosphatase MutT (NUDIX family)